MSTKYNLDISESSEDRSIKHQPVTVNNNITRENEITQPFDVSKVSIYHISELALALASEKFDLDTLYKVRNFVALSESYAGKMPLDDDNFSTWALTIAELSAHPENIEKYRSEFAGQKKDVLRALKSMAHSLKVDSVLFFNPESNQIHVASASFSQYFTAHADSITSNQWQTLNIKMLHECLKMTATAQDSFSKNNAVKVTFESMGFDTFYSQVVDLNDFLNTKTVVAGNLVPPTLLPFNNVSTGADDRKELNKLLISEAVQDLTGMRVIEFADSAKFSSSCVAYPRLTPQLTEDGEIVDTERWYYPPVTIAVDGKSGDCHTNDCLEPTVLRDIDPTYGSAFNELSENFAPFQEGPWLDQTRLLLTGDYDDVPRYEHSSNFLSKMKEVSSRRIYYDEQPFIKLKFSNLGFKEFVSEKPGVAMLDVRVVGKIMSSASQLYHETYHFFMVCVLSRRVLAIKRRYVTDPLFHHCLKNKLFSVGVHPIYTLLSPGLLVGFNPATSLLYAIMLHHHFKSYNPDIPQIRYDSDEVMEYVRENVFSGKHMPTNKRLRALLRVAHRQMGRDFSVYLAPSKLDSTISSSAIAELKEAFGVAVGEVANYNSDDSSSESLVFVGIGGTYESGDEDSYYREPDDDVESYDDDIESDFVVNQSNNDEEAFPPQTI